MLKLHFVHHGEMLLLLVPHLLHPTWVSRTYACELLWSTCLNERSNCAIPAKDCHLAGVYVISSQLASLINPEGPFQSIPLCVWDVQGRC